MQFAPYRALQTRLPIRTEYKSGCIWIVSTGQTKSRSDFDRHIAVKLNFPKRLQKPAELYSVSHNSVAFRSQTAYWAIPMHKLLGKVAWFAAFILIVFLLHIPDPCAALSENGARNLTHTCHPACPSHLHHITSDLRALTAVH